MVAGVCSYPDSRTPAEVVTVEPARRGPHGLLPPYFHAVLLGDDVLEEQAEPMVFQVGGAWAWRPATARELSDLLTKAFSDNDTHVNMMPRAFCCPLGGDLMSDPVMLESVRCPSTISIVCRLLTCRMLYAHRGTPSSARTS
eukprot:COSAG06_NODE_59_length_27189_cov_21.724527_19_plen_142_part_00